MNVRALAVGLVSALALPSALLVACSDDPVNGDEGRAEAGAGDAPGRADSAPPADGGAGGTTKDASDASLDARKPVDRDANGPGTQDAACSFNHDCQLSLRCECSGFDCACTPGARGTAVPGAGCATGEDCTTALCLDGPNDVLVCSDECETAANCPENLPVCSDIAGVGRICIRAPE